MSQAADRLLHRSSIFHLLQQLLSQCQINVRHIGPHADLILFDPENGDLDQLSGGQFNNDGLVRTVGDDQHPASSPDTTGSHFHCAFMLDVALT